MYGGGQNTDPQSPVHGQPQWTTQIDYPKNTISNEYVGLYVNSIENSSYLSLNTHFKRC